MQFTAFSGKMEILAVVNLNASHLCCVLLWYSVFEIRSKLCKKIPQMQISFYVYNTTFLNYCKEIIMYYFLVGVRKNGHLFCCLLRYCRLNNF